LESDWRFNVELMGWGGWLAPNIVPFGRAFQFMGELNPPLMTGSGLATWLATDFPDALGNRRWVFGNTDPLGYFHPLQSVEININVRRWPYPFWNVLPDH